MTTHSTHSHTSNHAESAHVPPSGRLHRIWLFIRKHRVASIVTAVIVLLVVLPVVLLLRPKEPQYIIAVAQKGDLQQTVEAVGTVTSERDLELKFPLGGIVESVSVKEGDRVHAGQQLAQLRSGNLGAAVAIQSANVQSALADLRKMEEGTRPEDIAIAEAQVANKQAALQVAQTSLQTSEQSYAQAQEQLTILEQEASTTLMGQVETSKNTLLSQLVAAETALSSVDDVLSKTIVQDAIIKSRPGSDADIRTMKQSSLASIADVRRQVNATTDYHDALRILQAGQNAVTVSQNTVDQLFALIGSLPETSYFTATLREQYRTSISTQRGLVQTAVSAVTTAYTGLQSAAAGFDTRIATAQATITASDGARQKAKVDILTYQTALQAQQADLASKRAGTRQADLDASRARLRQAQAALAQAQANYADSILRSPVEGTVSHVNIKVGEATPATEPAVTVLGNSPFRIEMNVSEVDVPKLQETQSGTITLDAFPEKPYQIRVSEVEAAPTLVDGVSKYKIKLDFVYPHDELKIGMTGDATVITGERKNVVSIPGRSVVEKDSKKYVRVLGADDAKPDEQEVVLGMEGQSGDVEVISGLRGGEAIVVLEK